MKKGDEVFFDPNKPMSKAWEKCYGRGPFFVHMIVRGNNEHYISLERKDGSILPLGGGEGLINSDFVTYGGSK